MCGKKRAHFEADIIACAVAPRARNDAGLKAYISWSPGAAEAARVVGRSVQAQLAASGRHTRVAVDAVTRSPPDLDTLKKSELAHGASWCQRRLFSPRNWSSVRPSAARQPGSSSDAVAPSAVAAREDDSASEGDEPASTDDEEVAVCAGAAIPGDLLRSFTLLLLGPPHISLHMKPALQASARDVQLSHQSIFLGHSHVLVPLSVVLLSYVVCTMQ